MKKLLNILVLLVYVNFLAIPTIAIVYGFENPTTKIILVDEESSNSSFSFFEKILPGTLRVHDFIILPESKIQYKIFENTDISVHLSPYLTIFSPPPELFFI